MTHLIRRILAKADVDRAVFFALLMRIWGLGTGPITLILIAHFFSKETQGYYYTFFSVVGLQTFLELGLSQVIVQFASHEYARLHMNARGHVSGPDEALSRLKGLLAASATWYCVAGFIALVGLSIGGTMFLSRKGAGDLAWHAPWVALCVAAAVNLGLAPVWSILEGCNQIAVLNMYRFFLGVITSMVVWTSLYSGSGLWLGSIQVGIGVLAAAVFLPLRFGSFFRSLLAARGSARIDWRREVWPMQWRIALSWASGYLAFSLFTPILFDLQGPAIAGQMGMTWSLTSAITTVASSWAYPRVPQFGILIARKDYSALDRLFYRVTAISAGVALLGALALFGSILVLNQIGHPFAERLLPPLPAGLFCLSAFLSNLTVPQSIYLRAHKKEPFLAPSVAMALLIPCLTWLFSRSHGATGAAAAYLLVVCLVLPWGTWIWFDRRRKWHQPSGPNPPNIPSSIDGWST